MSDDILELRLKEKDDKLQKGNEEMGTKKSQENEAESNTPTLKPMKRSHEEESSEQLNIEIKRPKLTAKSIPNWLIEVLAWIKRTEMANSKLSTSSWTFKQLCWPKLHGNVKERRVQRLASFYVQDSETFSLRSKLCKGNSDCFDFPSENYITIPIAKIDPPKYIIGFEQFHFRFLDGQILEFLKIVLPFIDSIFLHFRCLINGWEEDNIRIGTIRRLLSILAPKTFGLSLHDFCIDLCVLNRLFPGFIEEVQYIEMSSIISEWDLLLEWLNTERTDGEPKLLLPFIESEHENDIWDRIKKEFLLSKRRATFVIFIGRAFMEDQTIENEETGEVLSIYLSEETRVEVNDRVQFIVRHQKGMEYLRKNWEKRNSIIGNWGHEFTNVGVEIQEIGIF